MKKTTARQNLQYTDQSSDFYGQTLPRVPDQYAKPDGRKTIAAQSVLQRCFTGLNLFVIAVFAVVPVSFLLIALIVVDIVRTARRNWGAKPRRKATKTVPLYGQYCPGSIVQN